MDRASCRRGLGAACVLLLLAGCGGGGAERGLDGSWFGPTFSGSVRRYVIDGRGTVLQIYKDGTPTGVTGTVRHKEGRWYEVALSDKATGAFLMGETGNHAALFISNDDLMVLEREAEFWNPDGYDLSDVAPGDWIGRSYFLSKAGVVLDETSSLCTIEDDGAFVGTDDQGRIFVSPADEYLETLDVQLGIFGGQYADQFHPDQGDLTLLLSPDKTFVVAFANWPPWDIASGWVGTWTRDEPADPPVEMLPAGE